MTTPSDDARPSVRYTFGMTDEMGDTETDVQTDVAIVQRIGAVPSILDVVCRTTGMGFAAVARVTKEHWIACAVRDDIAFGLAPGGELKVETTICHEIHETREGVAIDHVANSPSFCDHPTPAIYGFQSYIAMPIMLPDGSFFGTLCAIDPKPNRVSTPEIVGMFRLFAELIGFHIDGFRRLEASEANLLGERATSELREQFIAVLGHDLRNPLASIQAGTRLLARGPLDAKASKIIGLIQGSIVRMAGLIDNVMDFARGRLGSGITLDREAGESIEPTLRQVIDELRSIAPDREIEMDCAALTSPVDCDQGRIAQLFSNLLGNALTHGSAHTPVRVRAASSGDAFELSVANAGEPISPAVMEGLFQPFSKRSVRPRQQGLGLGLFIASEIARAHGGTLSVSSDRSETRFTLRMPVRQDSSA